MIDHHSQGANAMRFGSPRLPRPRRLLLALATVHLLSAGAAAAQVLVPNLIYNTVVPCRVLDTRSSTAGKLLASTVRTFNIVGNTTGTYFTNQGGPSGGCAVPGFQQNSIGEAPVRGAANPADTTQQTITQGPAQVQAVVINLAVINPAGSGLLNAWPTDHTMPGTSLINYTAGTPALANEVVVAVRQDTQGGDISVVASTNTNLVGDIVGYFSSSSATTTVVNANQNNVFLGPGAGNPLAVTGSQNVGLGYMALPVLTSGGLNVAIGEGAMSNATEAGLNIAIGPNSLNSLTTGSFNIAISGGEDITTESYNVYIDNSGTPGDSGVIRIGTDVGLAANTAAYIAGISGVTSSGGTAVYINTDGQLGTLTSSLRFKEDVQDIGDTSAGLMQLRPVSFHYRPEFDDGSHLLQYGLVAEEVARVYPDLVQTDREGRPIAVRTHFINAMMLNEVQRQHGTIAAQQARIDQQQAEIEELQRQVRELLQQRAAGPTKAAGPGAPASLSGPPVP
jgi:hypothetical protein